MNVIPDPRVILSVVGPEPSATDVAADTGVASQICKKDAIAIAKYFVEFAIIGYSAVKVTVNPD